MQIHEPTHGVLAQKREIDAKTPPFECVAELEKEIQVLDEWVHVFIGRMQPYSHNNPTEIAATLRDAEIESNRSPLEERVILARTAVREITNALDEMNQRLRL